MEAIKSFQKLVDDAEARGMKSCSILVGLIHTKGQDDYELVILLGCFRPNEIYYLPDANNRDGCELKSNPKRAFKFFKISYDISDTRQLIDSLTATSISFPKLKTVKHGLDLSAKKPITYISSGSRVENFLEFLPLSWCGISLYELLDLREHVFDYLNDEDIVEINKVLLKHCDFSLDVRYRARVGNLLFVADLEAFRITFKADESGIGIRIKIVPQVSGLDFDDYILIVTSEYCGEMVSHKLIRPIKNSLYLRDINLVGKIDLKIWKLSTGELIAHDCGYRQKLEIKTRTSQRVNRIGFIRNSSGKIIKTDNVAVAFPCDKPASKKMSNDWQRKIQDQQLLAKKHQLLVQKKLIQLKPNDHLGALDEIIALINTVQHGEEIRIWDPYTGSYYLDFLTYLQKPCKVKILSGLKPPPVWSADAYGTIKASLNGISFNANFYRPLKENQNLKIYLDELRTKGIDIELRYKGMDIGFAFHDRFLMVGNRCWQLGSSLNNIGVSPSTIIDIPYPEMIMSFFDKLWVSLKGCEL